MLIPEVIIYNTLTNFRFIAASDYETKVDKTKTIIHSLFKKDDNSNDILLNDYDYYKQAAAILSRNIENTRRLEFNIGYNMKRTSVPTVHILMPSENKGRIDTVGHSEEKVFDEQNGVLKITKTRSNSSTYYLMITSDNSSEVMIIYYWLKAMMLLFHEEMELLGLRNLNNSGQDLNIQQEYAPPGIFHRNLALSFDYESSVSIDLPMDIITGINFGICIENNQYFEDYNKGINPQSGRDSVITN